MENKIVEYDEKGRLVLSTTKVSIFGEKCPTCGHREEIGIRDNTNPIYVFMLQILGGLFTGFIMIIAHYKVMPIDSFATQQNAIYSLILITPSFCLWLSLYTLQFMGLFEAWLNLIFTIVGVCLLVIVGIYVLEWLEGLPVVKECEV